MTTKNLYFSRSALAWPAVLMMTLMLSITSAESANTDDTQPAESNRTDSETSENWNFKPIDKNNDGVLDKKEVRGTRLENNWDSLDTNENDTISGSEFSAFMNSSLTKEEVEEIQKHNAEDAKPTESWFTSPQHDPSDDND